MEADCEQAWTRAGWGERLSWATLSARGERLAFSLRLPLAWTSAPLLDPSADAVAPTLPAARSLAAWSRLPGAITAQRLELLLPRADGPGQPVIASLIATLGAVKGLPAQSRLRTVSEPAGAGAGGGPSLPVLVLSYLLLTPYGGLAVAFSAPQAPFHAKLERLFDEVAKTIRLEAVAASHAA